MAVKTLGFSIWALGLDVTGLLALVAHALSARARRAVPRQMADLSAYKQLEIVSVVIDCFQLTVIALLALGAITAHVTEAATGIASLAATAVASAITSGEATTTAIASSVSTSGAVTCDVADFTALVALLAGTAGTAGTARTAAGAAESATRLGRRAVTRHVSGGTAVVAGLESN